MEKIVKTKSDNITERRSLARFICSIFLFAGFITCFTNQIYAQLTVNNTLYTPAQLVSDVLLGGGVAVSNVQFNGVVNSEITG